MTYYHNVQQTRNSGLDREMRLAADPEFVSFVRSKRNFFALKNFSVKAQWITIPAEKSISPGKNEPEKNINGKSERC